MMAGDRVGTFGRKVVVVVQYVVICTDFPVLLNSRNYENPHAVYRLTVGESGSR
jgi:hypothetical protein